MKITAAICCLAAAVAVRAESKVQILDPLLLREALGGNARVSFVAKPLPHMEVFKEQSQGKTPDAFLFNSGDLGLSQKGYRDKVDCFVLLSPDGAVLSVILGDNKESPKFVNMVLEGNLLKDWRGKKDGDEPPDTITSATFTSGAVNASVEAVLGKLSEIKFFP